MTDSIEIQLADAIVTRINAGTYEYSESFTASRAYLPVYTPETSALTVRVIPAAIEPSELDRDGTEFRVTVHIGIQKKLSAVDTATIDPLMRLVEQIVDQLRGFNLQPDTLSASFLGHARDPLFDQERLDSIREFAALISVTYDVVRDFTG